MNVVDEEARLNVIGRRTYCPGSFSPPPILNVITVHTCRRLSKGEGEGEGEDDGVGGDVGR